MNLAFRLQNNDGLREDELLQPYEIVSLWEMLPFYASHFVNLCSNLARSYGYIQALESPHTKSESEAISLPILSVVITAATGHLEFKQTIEQLLLHSRAIGLPTSVDAAQILLEYISNENKERYYKDIKEKTGNLIQTIVSELRGKVIMMLSPTGAQFYEIQGTILGKDIISKFGDLEEDADEAGKCYALGRYTACVFHLMRIMERIVRKLSTKLKIKFNPERDTWQRILKRVKTYIDDDRKMPVTLPRQIRRKARYQQIYLDLDAIKDAWRNPTMHPKATYSEEETKKIIEKVKDFIGDFSKLQ